jgi:hypothetical protein
VKNHQHPKHGPHSGHHDVDKSYPGHPMGANRIAAETTLHQKGMIRNEPNAVDESTRCRGPSVDHEATRGSVAPTPGTLGPRHA